MPSPVITLNNIHFSYQQLQVLENVSLTINKGEFIGLVGPNGGGKSTLIKIMLGLLKPQQGNISIMGKPVKAGRKSIGYVPQYVTFSRDFPITVEEVVLLGLLGQTKSWFGYTRQEKQRAYQAMEESHILNLRSRQISALSGGQFQRVLIARALISSPEVLILDEPTANIDVPTEENIFDLLRKLNERTTIIVVSHDIGFISEYVNRVACLNRTLVCHETSCISGQMIEEIYGTHVHMIDHHHH